MSSASGPGSESEAPSGPTAGSPSQSSSESPSGGRQPEFGPPGYLPERAASRARKIVLRAPLGRAWIIAAVAAGVVIAGVAVAFFVTSADPTPAEPFVAVGAVETVAPARYDQQRDVLYVGAAGRVRTFAVGEEPRPVWCAASGRIESVAGRVFSPTGRALDGGPSLDQHPTVVVDGTVYVDFTRTESGAPPRDTDAKPACF